MWKIWQQYCDSGKKSSPYQLHSHKPQIYCLVFPGTVRCVSHAYADCKLPVLANGLKSFCAMGRKMKGSYILRKIDPVTLAKFRSDCQMAHLSPQAHAGISNNQG